MLVHLIIFIFFSFISLFHLAGDSTYDICIKGVREDLKEEFIKTSSLYRLQNIPIKSLSQLDWRTQNDLKFLKRLYQEKGYLSPELSYKIDSDEAIPKITLKGASGKKYTLKSVEISEGERNYLWKVRLLERRQP